MPTSVHARFNIFQVRFTNLFSALQYTGDKFNDEKKAPKLCRKTYAFLTAPVAAVESLRIRFPTLPRAARRVCGGTKALPLLSTESTVFFIWTNRVVQIAFYCVKCEIVRNKKRNGELTQLIRFNIANVNGIHVYEFSRYYEFSMAAIANVILWDNREKMLAISALTSLARITLRDIFYLCGLSFGF